MYVTISAQKLEGSYPQSVSGYVAYLEKENEGVSKEEMEHFFNQYGEAINREEVIKEIDSNTAKLKKTEPKFYSITINPSHRELRAINNSVTDLKRYTKAVMEAYVTSFNREINGRKVTIADIKYYAKLEHKRYFKGSDTEIIENQKYASEILKLKQELRKFPMGIQSAQKGTQQTTKKDVLTKQGELHKRIEQLEREAPHQLYGKRIVQGMEKPGNQSHIHIIVSRKDASNSVSLSPGSTYKASKVTINGKEVKRGFDRNQFYKDAEKVFDRMFVYNRNYVESYKARKLLKHKPTKFFLKVLQLPSNEKALALKLLKEQQVPVTTIPTNKVQLAIKALKQIKKGIDVGIRSSSIGY